MENVLHLCGDIAARPLYSHESHGIIFHTFPLSVMRLSGTEDLLNVIAPEVMLKRFSVGDRIRLFGQIRSYSHHTDKGGHLLISAWAKSLDAALGEPYDNRVSLTGQIARDPVYRCTPYGREITDVMLKCPRPVSPRSAVLPLTVSDSEPSGDASAMPVSDGNPDHLGGFVGIGQSRERCDFIPCVTWGSVARLCADMNPGVQVSFSGRFQSRPYTKLIEGVSVGRVAYEVSVAQVYPNRSIG